ncbi:MAG: membrane protein insertion efficiency factor YidD [Micrococcales bacterium]|nr:membrane protein insertion efficiency factor YidD [Micrococcales bacterium]MCL2666289.1 membrane protein insertion efficiency factor YidD [Micrococcales bacterium]
MSDTLVRRAAVLVASVPRRMLLGVLWVYQHGISPWTPPSCKFYPSCSQYAVVAVTRHGAVRGSWLAVRRLARCHPWSHGGVDEVPPSRTPTTASYEVRSFS